MATRKAGKKSSKRGKTTGSSKTKSGGKTRGKRTTRRKPLSPPQEPIIIGGGGSVEITFPGSFASITSPGRGRFKNGGVNLTQLVVLDSGGRERHRMTLNRTDSVVVCFTGSLCI